MSPKKVPLRKCIACNQMKPKYELIRIVKNNDGIVSVDLTGKANGRGAYICANLECFNEIVKNKKLSRQLQTEISDDIYQKLREVIKE
ncbi:MAG: YlxR family protein [Tissierellales bacterium]|nr:YlxR family protein [Tissierellales bacterium]